MGSDDGGVQLARLLSMPANCQMHGVAPERWLAVVLVQVGVPGVTVDALMSRDWRRKRGAPYVPVFDTG